MLDVRQSDLQRYRKLLLPVSYIYIAASIFIEMMIYLQGSKLFPITVKCIPGGDFIHPETLKLATDQQMLNVYRQPSFESTCTVFVGLIGAILLWQLHKAKNKSIIYRLPVYLIGVLLCGFMVFIWYELMTPWCFT